VGGFVVYKNLIDPFFAKTRGLGVTADRQLFKNFYLTGELGYDLPVRIQSEVLGTGGSSSTGTGQEYILVPTVFKINTMHLTAGLKLDVPLDKNLTFYVIGETGWQMSYVDTQIGEYDHGKYKVEAREGKKMYIAVPLIPGIGLQYNLGSGFFYSTCRISMPTDDLGPINVDATYIVPAEMSISFGLKGLLK
jgi:hypothetical protein